MIGQHFKARPMSCLNNFDKNFSELASVDFYFNALVCYARRLDTDKLISEVIGQLI